MVSIRAADVLVYQGTRENAVDWPRIVLVRAHANRRDNRKGCPRTDVANVVSATGQKALPDILRTKKRGSFLSRACLSQRIHPAFSLSSRIERN